MSTGTITREKLLTLMEEWGQPGSGAFVADVLDNLNWGTKTEFTKADVVTVLEGITQASKELIRQPGAIDADAESKAHMNDMLDALSAHALPLLRKDAAPLPS